MKEFLKGKWIYISGIIFIAVLVCIVIVAIQLGKAYRGGLNQFTNQNSDESVNTRKRKKVNNIIIKKNNEDSCIKVTPDGIVRIYKTCSDDLETAVRLVDAKNILKLFRIITETDLKKLQSAGQENYYILTIETDEGTEIVYLAENTENTELIKTIEDIEEDIPSPTPQSSTQPSVQPSNAQTPIPSPSPGFSPQPSSTPSVASTPSPQTFSCDFDEFGNKRPHNVSNIICSTDPTPAP